MEFFLRSILGPLVVTIIGGITVLFWRKSEKTTTENLNLKLRSIEVIAKDAQYKVNNHTETCNEIPKSLIMDKLEQLCEKQDDHHKEITSQLDKIKDKAEAQGNAITKIETTLKLKLT